MCEIGVPVLGLITHTRKVQNLYKKILRNLESYYDYRPAFRFQAALMRQKFEDNRCVIDLREAKDLVNKAEEQLFKVQHYHLRRFPQSYGGSAFERVVTPPDWILDYWHPLEKLQYPDYFNCRSVRKEEYIRYYEEEYGDDSNDNGHKH